MAAPPSGASNEYFEWLPIRKPVSFKIVEVGGRNEIGTTLIAQPDESLVSEIDLAIFVTLAPHAHCGKIVQPEVHDLDLRLQQPVPISAFLAPHDERSEEHTSELQSPDT